MTDWYSGIEEPVREIVRILRNNGINTTCSCGHKMYIEADLLLDGQLWQIHKTLCNYLFENNLVATYSIEVRLEVKDGWPRQCFANISLKEIGIKPLDKEL